MKKNILKIMVSIGLALGSTQGWADEGEGGDAGVSSRPGFGGFSQYFESYGVGEAGGTMIANIPAASGAAGYTGLIGGVATGLYNLATGNASQFDYGGLGFGLAVGSIAYTVDTIGLGMAGIALSTPTALIVGGPLGGLLSVGTIGYATYNSAAATNFDQTSHYNNNVYNAMGDVSSGFSAPVPVAAPVAAPVTPSYGFSPGSDAGSSSSFMPEFLRPYFGGGSILGGSFSGDGFW